MERKRSWPTPGTIPVFAKKEGASTDIRTKELVSKSVDRLVTWHCSQQSGGECTLGGLPRMFIGAVAFLLIISLALPDWLGYSRLYLALITRFFLFR
jgi:hypothetical protein